MTYAIDFLDAGRLAAPIQNFREKVAALPEDKRAALDASLALTTEEHFEYQRLQSEMHAMGVLTPAEAQVLYVALGNTTYAGNGGWAKGCDTALKAVVTQVVAELLERKIRQRRGF